MALFVCISLPVMADDVIPTGRLPRNVVPTNVAVELSWIERMRTIEGGPRTLLQTIETVQLCSSLRELQLKQGVNIPK